MKVLITGGAGFIGSHTIDLFIKKGCEVTILDNLQNHNHVWPRYVHGKAKKIVGDIRRKKDWAKALQGITHVIHLAGLMDNHLEFSDYFRTNTVGTANLYEVIVKKKYPVKKVVIASTQYVYGLGKWKCPNHGSVKMASNTSVWDPYCPLCTTPLIYQNCLEADADPINQYAISKYSQEQIGLKIGKLHNIPTSVLRYSIVHGSRQNIHNTFSGALRTFTIQMINNQSLTFIEDGDSKRDFVSVLDVARANYLVAKNPASNYEIYNVGGGKAFTPKDLADLIAKMLKKNYTYESGYYRLGNARHAVSDISKISKLGWKPKISEAQSVKDFLHWFSSQNTSAKKLNQTFQKMTKNEIIKKIKN